MRSIKTIIIICLYFVPQNLSAQISFNPQTVQTTIGSRNLQVIDDFDSDSLLDLVVASSGGGSTMYETFYLWMYKQQSGQLIFQDTIKYTDSHYWACKSISSGDLNNDNRNDLIMSYGDTVRIFFQDSISGFFNLNSSQLFFPDSGMLVYGLECGDLNGDGLDDFAVTHWNNENLNVYYQNINQGFSKVVYYKKTAGRNELLVSDINNDGFQDLIVSNGTVFSSMGNGNKYSFAIYLQDTMAHTLQFPLFYAMDTITSNAWISNYASGIAVGDIDQDGFKDIVISRIDFQEAYIWHHDPASTVFFPDPPDTLSIYANPGPIYIQDLNNDFKNEIIVSHQGYSSISIFESDSLYNFSNYTIFQSWNSSNNCQDELAVADLNNDGWKDILSTFDYGFDILYNNTGVGINEIGSSELSFSIYPNPVINQQINLNYIIPQSEEGEFKLLDITGRVVFSYILPSWSKEQNIIFPPLSSGIYSAILCVDEIRSVKKIVILNSN